MSSRTSTAIDPLLRPIQSTLTKYQEPARRCATRPGERTPYMKKILLSLAAVAALAVTADRASAQTPAPVVASSSGCNNCSSSSSRIGGFGLFSGHGLFSSRGGHGFFGSGKTPPPPQATGGQLAFPQHPFVRSPRDFFMQ